MPKIREATQSPEALRAIDERFRALVESLHLAVRLQGTRAEVLYANKAAEELFGVPLERARGKTSAEIGLIGLREDGTELPFPERPVPVAIATRKPVHGQVVGIKHPGSRDVKWLLMEAVPLFNKEGNLEIAALVATDITRQKETEQALHQLSSRLLRLQDEERRRLGRELHDGLAQSVLAVTLDLAQLARSRAKLDREDKQAMSRARSVLSEMSRQIRTLSYLLHPPALDEMGLASAVREYALGFTARSGIALELGIQRRFQRLSQEAETALFRILQESLSNIQKHSGSATGSIRLRKEKRWVELKVSDQGRGMAAKPQPKPASGETGSRLGVGILGMRERMAQFQGTLEVESSGSGTTVRARIPSGQAGSRGPLSRARRSGRAPHVAPTNARLGSEKSKAKRPRRSEVPLSPSDERFRSLIQRLHVAVVLQGTRAEVLFCNRAAEELYGVTLESARGKTTAEIGIPVFREDGTEMPFPERPVPRAIAARKPLRGQVVGFRHPVSQDVRWLLLEVVPLFDKEGTLEMLGTIASDITRQKETEQALHQLSSRLLRLQDEERRKLGRELHEGLAQSVLAVTLDLAQLARSRAKLDQEGKQAISRARGVLSEMSRQIRTLSYLLHPPALDEMGLASAVKEYARGFVERSHISLQLEIASDFPRLPQDAETALFRIVQESLSNIQRHSGTRKGRIRLGAENGWVELQVSDQGRGLAAKQDGGKGSRLGVGILGMQERMKQFGGTLEVESSGSGTTVRARIPLATGGNHAAPSHSRR